MPRLYVGGLPVDTRPRDMEKLFRDYGEIMDIDLKGRFGFVELRSRRDAEDAVHDLDGVRFLGGRVSVEFSRAPRRERRGPPGSSPYRVEVENVSSRVHWQDLKDLMRKAGEVVFADCHKRERGLGIVEFERRDDMEYALRKLDGVDLMGRRIVIREAMDGRSRRRSRSPRRSRTPPRGHSRKRSYSRSMSRGDSRSRSVSRSRARSHSRTPVRSRSRTRSSSLSRSHSLARSRSAASRSLRDSRSVTPVRKRSPSRSRSPRLQHTPDKSPASGA